MENLFLWTGDRILKKDEFIYDEMVTHVPMAVHPCVKDVLIIGGGDGGVAKELLQYDCVEHIDVVETDEMFVEVSRKIFPGGSLCLR